MRAHFVELGGVRTRYLRAGDGPPVFLLHGVGMTADSWVKNIGPLSERFSVYAPDLLGCGFTECGVPSTEAPQLAIVQHLENLADSLDLQTFSVIGSSLGGLIASLAYLQMPGRIDRLVIVGAASLLAATRDELRGVFEASHKNGGRAFADNSISGHRQRLANLVTDVRSIPSTALHMQINAYGLPWAQSSYERRITGLIAHLKESPDAWVMDRLEKIEVPVLLIAGKNDPRTSPAWEDLASLRLPRAERMMFENCGHFPHLEYPDEFNAAVQRFLQQQA